MDNRFNSAMRIFVVLLFIAVLSANAFAILASGNIKIFAVTEDEKGMAAELNLYTIAGSGDVAFITSNSLVGKDTQTTGNIALQIASKKASVSKAKNNFIFDIKANASEVDGPSAGAAMTLLAYSILSEKALNPQVGLTGTINSDGSVGVVGGVYPKSKAAADVGIKLLMIPKGEANQVIQDGGKVTSVNMLSYGPDTLGMKIVEVSTIDDVIKYAYSDIAGIEVDVNSANIGFIPSAIKYNPLLAPMKALSQKYIDSARAAVDDAKKELELTTLDDATRSSFYPRLGVAERNIEMSKVFLDQNYLYSAANYSFNAKVLSGAILEIAKNPSMLSMDSAVLASKLSAVEQDLAMVKGQMDFVPTDKVEWLIGAQQRLAYAQNALAGIRDSNIDSADPDLQAKLFDRVYDFVSAEEWIVVGKDFLAEAQKSTAKKIPKFSPAFIAAVDKKLADVKVLLDNKDIPADSKDESVRRYNSALLSYDSNFYFAALYDAYFAEAFSQGALDRNGMDVNKLLGAINGKLNDGTALTSFWANLYLDHAHFYVENAKYMESLGQQLDKQLNLETSYDLVVLSDRLEEAKGAIDEYLAFSKLEDYSSSEPMVGVTYKKVESFSPLLVAIVFILVSILVLLIVVGLNMRRALNTTPYVRAEKLNTVLFNLDRAFSQNKISDAEYFFMRKKYEDELSSFSRKKAERSKAVLSVDDSNAKLRALENGLKDLKRHYRDGLILPEDYERHFVQVNKEIDALNSDMGYRYVALRESRRRIASQSKPVRQRKEPTVSAKSAKEKESAAEAASPKWKKKPAGKASFIDRLLGRNRVKGTAELVEEEFLKEKEEKAKRKKLLKQFRD